jgi:hypothetical protein
MTTNALLVATATQWYGAARMSRCLAEAGFTVSLLTPENSPSEKSRFLTKVGHIGPNTTWHQWVFAFAAMVKATSPRVVLPCDDTAVRLMQALVLTPPDNLQPALRVELGSLITESLGTPAHYHASIDKTLISPAAQALGIRVPAFAVVSEQGEAQRFALQHGFPVVIKRNHSSAGQGVAICADAAALSAAFETLGQPDGLALGDARDGELLVQAHIPGRIHYHNSVAWQGVLLAGQASEQLAATARGPASAVRYYHSPVLRAMSATLAAGFGISGVYVPEFVIHEDTGGRLSAGDQSPDDAWHASGRGLRRRSRRCALRGGQRTPVADAARPRSGRRAFRRPLSAGMDARPGKPLSARISGGRALGRAGARRGHRRAGDGEFQERVRPIGYGRLRGGVTTLRITGRVGLRRATSTNPARSNIGLAPNHMKSSTPPSGLSQG